ncbi:MAG: two-component system response regulator, partial [Desulfobacterales bacterium]|nr:two-component system response regulator [Desulfobacterales bacterium]
LERFAEKNRKTIKGFTPGAMDGLIRCSWPGNVRELMNAVERAVVLAPEQYLTAAEFPMIPQEEGAPAAGLVPAAGGAKEVLTLDNVERATILQTMEAVGGNKSEAARRLGITRKTLHSKLKKYGVKANRR